MPTEIVVDRVRLIRRVFVAMLAVELALVALDTTINFQRWIPIGAIRRLFNIAREDSLPAWIASAQTLVVGGVLWLVYLRVSQDRAVSPWIRRGWALMATFFCYMALDDGSSLHERLGTAFEELVEKASPPDGGAARLVSGFPSYTWQLVLGPFFGAMGLLMFLQVWRAIAARALRALFLAGIACYVVGVGLDFVEGIDWFWPGIATRLGMAEARPLEHYGRVVEEFLEMLGTTFFLCCFLTYFTQIAPNFCLRFAPSAGGSEANRETRPAAKKRRTG